MKKRVQLVLMLFGLMVLSMGCSSERKNVEEMKQKYGDLPVSDFEKLRRHTLILSENEQPIENIAKLYFYEIHELEWKNQLAIDIGNKCTYLSPQAASIGLAPTDYELQEKDLKMLKEIFKDSQIGNWEESYMFGDEEMLKEMGGEGYNWELCLQYLDGTSFYKKGQGVSKQEIQPEGYDTFVNGLTDYIASKDQLEK